MLVFCIFAWMVIPVRRCCIMTIIVLLCHYGILLFHLGEKFINMYKFCLILNDVIFVSSCRNSKNKNENHPTIDVHDCFISIWRGTSVLAIPWVCTVCYKLCWFVISVSLTCKIFFPISILVVLNVRDLWWLL